MIIIIMGIMMVLVVLFFGIFINKDFWQGYHNSKFLDEYLNKDTKKKEAKKIKHG